MGVKSTYQIKREVAQQVLLSNVFKLSNEQLADALEALPQSQFRNYAVTDGPLTYEPDRAIVDVNEFEHK